MPNDPKLSHGHWKVTPKCNRDNQFSYHRRNCRRSGRWLQRGVRRRTSKLQKSSNAKSSASQTSYQIFRQLSNRRSVRRCEAQLASKSPKPSASHNLPLLNGSPKIQICSCQKIPNHRKSPPSQKPENLKRGSRRLTIQS
jgi:hypothetical protein